MGAGTLSLMRVERTNLCSVLTAVLLLSTGALLVGCDKKHPSAAQIGIPEGRLGTHFTELEITDLVEGEGPAAESGDSVYVLYSGQFVDGEEFDSNLTAEFPFHVVIDQTSVIQGWHDGLKGMKKGGKRRLGIPSALAYGPHGSGDRIPPNTDLVFEIELLDLVKSGDEDIVTFEDLTVGEGREVLPTDTIVMTYRCLSPTGHEAFLYESQEVRISDLTVPGLVAGITGYYGDEKFDPGMRVGGKRKIRVGPRVGFGPGGRPDFQIPGSMVLIFEVELERIVS